MLLRVVQVVLVLLCMLCMLEVDLLRLLRYTTELARPRAGETCRAGLLVA
jgi:hypothetical protein